MNDKVKKVIRTGVKTAVRLYEAWIIANGVVAGYQIYEFRKMLDRRLKEEKLKEEQEDL